MFSYEYMEGVTFLRAMLCLFYVKKVAIELFVDAGVYLLFF